MKPSVHIFCDLEGVLAPEMWPHVAQRLGITALAATTREHPDYRSLVAFRIKTLRTRGISLADLCALTADIAPFDGAVAFVEALRHYGDVTLVTDSFAPMNATLVAAFSVDQLLGHRFIPDSEGFIAHCAYWNNLAGKQLCLAGIKGKTVAIGDAFNDLPLLRRASRGFLFRPSIETERAATGLPIARSYAEVIDTLSMIADDGLFTSGEL